jgi:uncharacterized protein YbjT (DUF2867 family)
MYLITGATGNVGKELVELLVAANEPVRVLVRDPRKVAHFGDRIEVAVGDFGQPESLAKALHGVGAAFYLVAGFDGEEATRSFVAAAKASGAPRIVMLSSLLAAMPESPLGRHHLEKEQIIRDSGLPSCFLRPGMFMSNTFQWAESIKSQGVVYNAFGNGKQTPIAPRDIAAVAVRALTGSEHTGQAIELTGGEALSTPEQVEILSRVLERPLHCVDISVETAIEGMIKSGLPAAVARGLGALFQRTRDGQAAYQSGAFARIIGHQPTPFEDWARENAAAWRAG